MSRLLNDVEVISGNGLGRLYSMNRPDRRSRRRLFVFVLTFLICLITSQIYNLQRPAVYRSSASLLTVALPGVDQPGAETDIQHVMLQRQRLLSKPLLDEVIHRLHTEGSGVEASGLTAYQLQSMLSAVPGQDKRSIAQMEKRAQELREQLVQIQIASRHKYPQVKVVEWAFPPKDPIHPLYLRDAAIAFFGSILAAFLMVWLVDFLAPKDKQNDTEALTGVVFHFVELTILLLFSSVVSAGLPETVVEVKKSILSIGTYQRLRTPPANFSGTGFVVAKGNHVVTNAHVVPDNLDKSKNEIVGVFFRKGEKVEMRRAELVAKDKEHDIAILYIPGEPLQPLELGDDAEVVEGRLYGFTGFPIGMVLGVTPVTHRGIVSAITPIAIPAMSVRRLNAKRLHRLRDPYKVFQLDAIAYPGNSGSPLYEIDTGKVVGVVNSVFVKETKESILSSPSGISYAIPSRYIKALLKANGLMP